MKKIILSALIMSLLLPIVYGAVSCSTEKATSGTARGVTMFNATLSGITAAIDYNATAPVLFMKCTDTANSSYVAVKNDSSGVDFTNISDYNTGTELNISVNIATAGLEDSANCYAYIIVSNDTQGENEISCSASSAFTIDLTKPDTPTLSSCENIYNRDDVISYAVNGTETTSCTIYFDTNDYSMTHSGSTCTYTIARGSPPDKAYEIYVTATDGLNSSSSSICNAAVDAATQGSPISGAKAQIAQEGVQKKGDTLIILLLVVVVLIVVFKKKK